MTKAFAFAGNRAVGNMVADRLTAEGWQRVSDVASADAVLTYFTVQSALEDAYFGDEGIVQAAHKGALLIDLSPTTPTFARELAAMATVVDLVAVEAPLIVEDLSVPDAFGARENLACLVGGEEDFVDAAKPVLDILFASVSDAGGPGAAQLARAAYSLQAVSQVISAIEADALYHAVRTSTDMGEITGMRAGALSPMGSALLAAVTEGRFEGTFTVEMLMADLTAALTTADDADLILPQAEAAQHLLELLAIIGGSDMAPSALSLVYREEEACAEAGLDWSRAEATYGDHDHAHDEDDDADYSDDFGEAGFIDDDGMTGSYPGYNGLPYSSN